MIKLVTNQFHNLAASFFIILGCDNIVDFVTMLIGAQINTHV